MLIAIEGIDGSGKGTQAKLLVKHLTGMGKAVRLFSFPYYSETFFGKEIGKYLNGHYGQLAEVPVEFASLLFAGDRFEKKEEISRCLEEGIIVVCDRYVSSNFAHQAAKLPVAQQEGMKEWISTVEYKIFGMPKPDLVFLLDLPAEKSREFVMRKQLRDYTEEKLDLHEAASSYLVNVSEAYRRMAKNDGWKIITYENGNTILSIDEVAKYIAASVDPLIFAS